MRYAAILRTVLAAAFFATVLMLAGGSPLVKFAYSHVGHGTEEVGEYDLDSPRTLSPETAKHIGLKTAEVDFQPIEEVVEISGIVKPQPDRHRSIVSLIEGQVSRVHVQVGDTVKKGDILVEIESLSYLERWSRLLILRAQINALELEREAAADEYDRTKSLAGEAVPHKEIAVRKAELAKIESELNLARIETHQIEAWLRALASPGAADSGEEPSSHLSIKAPSTGVVVKRLAMPGQWIEAGETIVETADYRTVQVEGELPESLIARVRARKTNKVRVRVPSDSSFLGEGTLRFMAPDLDPVKRTAHLIVDVPNPDGVLRGEMWVNLSVVLRDVKSAMVVPRSAVVVDGPIHYVFVRQELEEKDNEGEQYYYQKKDILPGYTADRYVEVQYVDSGLAPGDVVVTQGTYSLTQIRPTGKKKTAAPAEGGEAPEKGQAY